MLRWSHLEKVLVVDVGVFRARSESAEHGLEESNVFAAEEFHFLLEGLAHGDADGETELRTTPEIRLTASHLWIAPGLVGTVAGASVLRWSHVATFTAARDLGGMSVAVGCRMQLDMVAEETDVVILGMLILKGGA